ncbi:phage tail tube protein [Mycolicibacterium neoaurum]|uniref:phage tail tube protein n=1 Tax=Mycolicibacterium neoaurum TaxID=1795 RepID=UPI001F4CC89C|nr:phage tail tube protein [Mycolicibacterium neoaurum]
MATGEQYIGRREGIGLGIEGTAGTGVAAQVWLRWLEQDVQNKTSVIENESAMGVVDAINDSEVVAKWAEGVLSGKVTDLGIGFLLAGFYGKPSTGSATGGIYPHTYNMTQSSVGTTLTISRNDLLAPQTHSYAVIDRLSIEAEAGGWVTVEAAFKARRGQSAVLTPAFVAESEFTSKHVTVKLADSVANLGAATALKASRIKLDQERPSEAYNPLGTDENPEFDRGEFTVTGELVIRYTDTQYETDFLNNAIKAMGITIANGNKSLAFTASKLRYRELESSKSKDGIVTQTLSIKAEYDVATGRTIQAILRNERATYEAA